MKKSVKVSRIIQVETDRLIALNDKGDHQSLIDAANKMRDETPSIFEEVQKNLKEEGIKFE